MLMLLSLIYIRLEVWNGCLTQLSGCLYLLNRHAVEVYCLSAIGGPNRNYLSPWFIELQFHRFREEACTTQNCELESLTVPYHSDDKRISGKVMFTPQMKNHPGN